MLRNFGTVPPAITNLVINVRETRKKIVIKCRGESFARCRIIARYVKGGPWWPPPPPPSLIRVNRVFFFSHAILYPIQVLLLYPFGHFDLKETKKRPILVNNKPNCAGNNAAIGTRHRACAPRYRSQISYPFRGHVRGSCEFDTLFLRFPRFRYPKRDTRVTRLVAKKIPFLRVFIYADDVQAPMRHTPRG